MVEITVSGSIVNVPPANGSDGFYGIVDGVLVGPAPGEFRLARYQLALTRVKFNRQFIFQYLIF